MVNTPRGRVRLAASVALGAAVCAFPGAVPAHASSTGTAWVDGDTLVFRAGPTTFNRVRISSSGSDLVVLDIAPLTPGVGCRAVTAYKIACAANPVDRVDVDLGVMDDDFAISAPGLSGVVLGSTGNDFFSIEGDYFSGAPTGVVYLGGSGHDKISYGLSPVGVEVSKAAGRGDGRRVSDIDPNDCHYTGDEWEDPVDADDVRDDIEEIHGSAHGDIIEGSRSPYYGDYIAGGDGRDCLFGHDGHDRFLESDHANGSDGVEGGAGFDSIDYSKRSLPINGFYNETYDKQHTGQYGESDTPHEVERVYGGSGSDSITYRGFDVELHGGAGDDHLNAPGVWAPNHGRFLDSDNRLFGGAGDDRLSAHGGDDHLDGGPGIDRQECGPGTDSAVRTSGDTLYACETVS